MAYYRLYLRDAASRIDRFHQFQADNDQTAEARTEIFRNGQAMELWQGPRMVRRWYSLTIVPTE